MRRWMIGGALVLAAAALGGSAVAGHVTDGVKSYTGCIYTTSGLLTNVKEGDAPTMPCRAALGQTEIHLSGGDITRVAVGPGLTGGGDNGAVTIGLNAQQSLPACAAGQVPKWSGGGWGCAADNDTQYSAGTGLDLNGTTFSVEPDNLVQNNQSCAGGQFATGINGSGNLACASAPAGGRAFHARGVNGQGVNGVAEVAAVSLPAGSYLIFGKATLDNSDGDYQAANCRLTTGDVTTLTLAPHTDDGEVQLFSVLDAATFSGTTRVAMTCGTFDALVRNGVLTAVSVASVN